MWTRIICIVLTAASIFVMGCGKTKTAPEVVQKLEYTVVEDEDVPQELKEMIEAKKEDTLRLTYATNDYLYIVAGYGTKETSGYSIMCKDLYLGENAIYIQTELIGPKKQENVSKVKTYPYIVVKLERREEPVIFE